MRSGTPAAWADLGNSGNVEHFEAGIADGLRDHEAGVGTHGGAKAVELARLDERGRDRSAGTVWVKRLIVPP
jgi:hypothetical protein